MLLAALVAVAAAQQPVALPPGVTAEEGRIYQAFMTWFLAQSPELQNADDDVLYPRYVSSLQSTGQTPAQAAAAIEIIKRVGERMEAERWNRVLTSPTPAFNTAPNAFLV